MVSVNLILTMKVSPLSDLIRSVVTCRELGGRLFSSKASLVRIDRELMPSLVRDLILGRGYTQN